MVLKRYLIPAVILTAVSLIFFYYPSEEKRIRKVIQLCMEAVIDENIDQLMEHISFNYSHDHGGSYLQLQKRMERLFSLYHDLEITVDGMVISVEGEQSVAYLKVRVLASEGPKRGYLIGDAGSAGGVRLFLEKSPYEWKVVKSEIMFNME